MLLLVAEFHLVMKFVFFFVFVVRIVHLHVITLHTDGLTVLLSSYQIHTSSKLCMLGFGPTVKLQA